MKKREYKIEKEIKKLWNEGTHFIIKKKYNKSDFTKYKYAVLWANTQEFFCGGNTLTEIYKEFIDKKNYYL